MSAESSPEKALLRSLADPGQCIVVHFNPASLQYSLTNTLPDKGQGDKNKQHVAQTSGKLTLELVFDTTGTGQDVRAHTGEVARLMKKPARDKPPPVVQFEWGVYKFPGMLESYQETLDFFAAAGVPLRATVNLTLAAQDRVFDFGVGENASVAGQLEEIEVPASSDRGVTGVAAQGGDAGAGRDLAERNGEESMRFPGGDSLTVDGSVPLAPPVPFAGGAPSPDGGRPGGVFGGVFGGRASAGVPAGEGAFDGLRQPLPRRRRSLDVERFLPSHEANSLATDERASFALGGRASLLAGASLRADVGAPGRLRSRIQFDED
ncbi:MAG: hypothetical protein GY719_38045 [bacterium]|nr:hypothetical protein [bacterium]